MLTALELFWRGRGHRPSIVDDKDLWAYHRGRVDSATDTVVLVGDSRIQLGFASKEFYRRFPDRRLVNLALDGKAPLATLRDLAADESFRGTVICSATAITFDPTERDRQQGYVEHYHRGVALERILNRRLATLVQGSLVVANPRVKLSQVLLDLVYRRPLPQALYLVTHSDRSRSADYSLMHIESHRAHRVARRARGYEERRIPTPDAWREQVEETRPWVKRIQARGGRVVFVRFPTTGRHWQLDDEYYPRARYWDRLAEITGATTLHFRDDSRLSGFDCPDTSHLDYKDAGAFTRALLQVLFEERPETGPPK